MTRVAILTYHPIHIVENTYRASDLVALESDLVTIERCGIPVRSLDQIFAPSGESLFSADISGPVVAITLDDGSIFDFVDRAHPTCGTQLSAATILNRSARRNRTLAGARPRASTFVIASPEARGELDRKDYFGGGYWPDDWWKDAVASGILAIESHSWDHNHPSLERSAQRDNVRGTFTNIETLEESEAEIAQSVDYIGRRAGVRPKFFAYPWGDASDYVVHEYLPRRGVELGLWAALSATEATDYVTERSNRWFLPRFVCGRDWSSPEGLEALLAGLR